MALIALIVSILALLLALVTFIGFLVSCEAIKRTVVKELLSFGASVKREDIMAHLAKFEKDILRQGREDA